MAKRFFETFPALILEDELKDLFEFAEVTALKYNRDRTAIHVYLLCRRLISKPQIYAVESKIEKQMFPDGDMKIRIFESFSLSEQYTPSYLVDVYKDSLFAEIKRRSDLDYHILMRADWKVADDDSLLLTLEDSLWARNRAGELREWIQMVFYDRCAISIPVAVSFKERDTTAIEEEKKRAEAQAIARIMKANSVASKEKEAVKKLLLEKEIPQKLQNQLAKKTFRHRAKFQAAIFKNHPITRVIKADTAPSVLFVQTIQTWYMDAILRMSHQ